MENKKIQIVAIAIIVLAVAAGLWVTMKKPKATGGADAVTEGLNRPRGIALNAKGQVVVADSKNNRVEIRTLEGKVEKRSGKLGAENGQFRELCDVKVGPQGQVVVADTFHTKDPKGGLPWGRVQVLDANLKFQAAFGAGGDFGPLFGPRAVAVDSQGNIWLSDTGNHRLIKFGPKGEFQLAFGKRGKGKGEFAEPFGLAVDKQDNVYVADRLNYRIQVFGKDGSYKTEWKVEGWEETQACEPYLAIDQANGLIYATATTKNLVLRWNLEGKSAKAYQADASGAALNSPIGIAVRPDGTVLVSNGGNGSIVSLKP